MKIALVEDDERTRRRIERLLVKSIAEVSVTELPCLSDAKNFALQTQQDYWLIDLGLPDGSGVDLIRFVRALHAAAHILVISVFGDVDNIVKSIEAGANGYLLKDAIDKDLVQALSAIGVGGTPLSPLIASRLLERMLPPPSVGVRAGVRAGTASPSIEPATLLSARETELLNLLSRGYKYGEAASLMGITLSTVQTHIRRIYIKLAVESKSEAIFEAQSQGLLTR
jgi:DNA-binding NarL/FixJ family response regulator